MKKILFIGSLVYGGAERQMVELAKSLAKENYDVSYMSFGGNFYSRDLEGSKVRVIQVPKVNKLVLKLKLSILVHAMFLIRYINKEHVTVGISFLGECNFINCVAAEFYRRKYKAITGLRNARKSLLLSPKEMFYSKYEKYAYVKVCNSDNGLRLYQTCFPQYADKLTTIYNLIHVPQPDCEYCLRKDGITHIVVPASYREVKNPYGLLAALKLMTEEERKCVKIMWYGDTGKGELPYYKEFTEQVRVAGLQDRLVLKDATKDIINVMNEADAVALFSSSEGLPNAICEGLVLGKPIIMTRVSDYSILVDETNGFLCDWDRPESIKDSIVAISQISDQELQMKGLASQKKGIQIFSEDSNIQKWKQIIDCDEEFSSL